MAYNKNPGNNSDPKTIPALSMPNYAFIPNELIDKVLYTLSEIELKGLLILIQAQTFPSPGYRGRTVKDIKSCLISSSGKTSYNAEYLEQEIRDALNHLIQRSILEKKEIEDTNIFRYYVKIGTKKNRPEINKKTSDEVLKEGVIPPNYTLVPNELIDNVLLTLSEIELKSLLILLQAQTFPHPGYRGRTVKDIRLSLASSSEETSYNVEFLEQEIMDALNKLIQRGILDKREIEDTNIFRYYIKIRKKKDKSEIVGKKFAEEAAEEEITQPEEEIGTVKTSYAEIKNSIANQKPAPKKTQKDIPVEAKEIRKQPAVSDAETSKNSIAEIETKTLKDLKKEENKKIDDKVEKKKKDARIEQDLMEEIKEKEILQEKYVPPEKEIKATKKIEEKVAKKEKKSKAKPKSADDIKEKEMPKEKIAPPEKEKTTLEPDQLKDIQERLTSDLEQDILFEAEKIEEKKGKATWKAILKESANILDTFTFNQWLEPTKYKGYQKGLHLILVPSKKFYQWFEGEYKDTMEEIVNNIDPNFKYKFISEDE